MQRPETDSNGETPRRGREPRQRKSRAPGRAGEGRPPETRHREVTGLGTMGWEGAIDRLVLREIDLASRGTDRPAEIKALVEELVELAPERTRSYFHLGVAGALLDEDLFEQKISDLDPALRRWAVFGRVIGLAQRRSHARLAELLHAPEAMDLVDDAAIGRSVLPIMLRTAFADGDLDLALRALERSVGARGENHDAFREALGEILRRVERTRDRAQEESVRDLLVRCRDLPVFARLPDDVRVPFHRSIGRLHQHLGEWDRARGEFERCLEISGEGHTLASVLHFDLAACHLGVRGVPDLRPDPERTDCREALDELDRATADPRFASFNAYFARGILHYEKEDYVRAAADFELALDKILGYRNPLPVTLARIRYFLGVCLLAAQGPEATRAEDRPKAARLIEQGLERVRPDPATFSRVGALLGRADRDVALRFLDAIDLGQVASTRVFLDLAGAAFDLGAVQRAARLAEVVLDRSDDVEERRQALDLQLRCAVRLDRRDDAREIYFELRDGLLSRGLFEDLEALLRDDGRLGSVLDHFSRQCELNTVLELMAGRSDARVDVLLALARHLRSHKDSSSLVTAVALLEEAAVYDAERVRTDLEEAHRLAEHHGARRPDAAEVRDMADCARRLLGHDPCILVLGGGEAQRREIELFERLKADQALDGDWWLTTGDSAHDVLDRLERELRVGRVDAVVLLHWCPVEVKQHARDMCRSRRVVCRTLDHVGFVSLEVVVGGLLEKMARSSGRVHGAEES